MPKKSKKTEENQVIGEVANEIGVYAIPDEDNVENVLAEDAITEEAIDVQPEGEREPSPLKVSFFDSVQTLAQIVEDLHFQGKLNMKQSHDAYECFLNINALINEI